jgi:Protein of unknown function (DUF2637)
VVAAVGYRCRGLVLAAAVVTSSLMRVTTVGAVVVVAVIAAVVSYSHMQQLAASAGEDWRSWLIPLSIDGLVVAASMVLLTRRRTGLPGGPLAWGALGPGVGASLAANMADARPEPTAVLVAGWPAVAFAVAFELLLQQRRAEQHHTTPPVGESATEPVPVPAPEALPALPRPLAAPPVPAAPAPAVRAATAGTDPAAARVRELIEQTGRIPGRRVVARELGITEHQARTALERVTAPPRAIERH